MDNARLPVGFRLTTREGDETRHLNWTSIAVVVLILLAAALGGFLPHHLASVRSAAHGGVPASVTTPASPVAVRPTSTAQPATPTPTATATPTPLPTPMPTPTLTATVTQAPAAAAASPTATAVATPTAPIPSALAGIFSVAGANGITCQPPPLHDFATCQFAESPGVGMTFYLYLPNTFSASKKYPLVLLLEGGGERSVATNTPEQNRKVLLTDPYAAVWGPGEAIPDAPDVQQQWPSFVVIPQVASPGSYSSVPANTGSYMLPPQPTDALRMAKEIVDALRQDVTEIDGKRLYVTGLSMGGYGTWELIERYPNYFAAAAPIAGGGDPTLAARLVNVPIWAFHSADDPIVPVSASRDMIEAIREAGGHPLYTEFTNAGHGSWLPPYGIMGAPSTVPDFYTWLFAQHR